jgi:hypothetical protein
VSRGEPSTLAGSLSMTDAGAETPTLHDADASRRSPPTWATNVILHRRKTASLFAVGPTLKSVAELQLETRPTQSAAFFSEEKISPKLDRANGPQQPPDILVD